jgi:hypothetical protein
VTLRLETDIRRLRRYDSQPMRKSNLTLPISFFVRNKILFKMVVENLRLVKNCKSYEFFCYGLKFWIYWEREREFSLWLKNLVCKFFDCRLVAPGRRQRPLWLKSVEPSATWHLLSAMTNAAIRRCHVAPLENRPSSRKSDCETSRALSCPSVTVVNGQLLSDI